MFLIFFPGLLVSASPQKDLKSKLTKRCPKHLKSHKIWKQLYLIKISASFVFVKGGWKGPPYLKGWKIKFFENKLFSFTPVVCVILFFSSLPIVFDVNVKLNREISEYLCNFSCISISCKKDNLYKSVWPTQLHPQLTISSILWKMSTRWVHISNRTNILTF